MAIPTGERFKIANGYTDFSSRAVTAIHRHVVFILNNAENHDADTLHAAKEVWKNPIQYQTQVAFAMLNDDFINKDSVDQITDNEIEGAAATQWARLVDVHFALLP